MTATGVTRAQVPPEHWAILDRVRRGHGRDAAAVIEAIEAGIPPSIIAFASQGWTNAQLAEHNDTYLRGRTVARAQWGTA